MKPIKFLFVLCTAIGAFLLASCGGANEKTSDTSSTDTSLSTPSTAMSTIVTTPQTVLVVRHKISNFSKWIEAYDSHDSVRLSYGLHNYVIGRGIGDSNMVLVSLKADDAEKAKAFQKDPSLKQAMEKGGVTGPPSIMLNNIVFQDTAILPGNIIRVLTWFTVKDWDTWKKQFESNRQHRLDNGATDRVYGHDVDDNHKVSLVLAISDSAKAAAYLNSDVIKQKRAEAGVIGEPERFIFRIVRRY